MVFLGEFISHVAEVQMLLPRLKSISAAGILLFKHSPMLHCLKKLFDTLSYTKHFLIRLTDTTAHSESDSTQADQ